MKGVLFSIIPIFLKKQMAQSFHELFAYLTADDTFFTKYDTLLSINKS